MEDELISTGLIAYMNRSYKSAEDMFSKVLDKNQKSLNATLYRGITRVQLGLYTDAIFDLDNAEKLGNKNFEVYYNRGIAFLYTMDLEKAKSELEVAKGLATKDQAELVEKYLRRVNN